MMRVGAPNNKVDGAALRPHKRGIFKGTSLDRKGCVVVVNNCNLRITFRGFFLVSGDILFNYAKIRKYQTLCYNGLFRRLKKVCSCIKCENRSNDDPLNGRKFRCAFRANCVGSVFENTTAWIQPVHVHEFATQRQSVTSTRLLRRLESNNWVNMGAKFGGYVHVLIVSAFLLFFICLCDNPFASSQLRFVFLG